MANLQPKQSPDFKNALCVLVNQHLDARGWRPARLAEESGLSKATISRITRLRTQKDKCYYPKPQAIFAIALALRLGEDECEALFDAAYPGWLICRESIKKGRSLMDTNEIMYDTGCPLLTNE